MKIKSFKISVPSPCHQKWDGMTVVDGGKYCSSCEKVVVDFSGMSDEQMINYLLQKKSNVCGRIQSKRLSKTYSYPVKTPFQFNFTVLKYSLAGMLTFSAFNLNSQEDSLRRDASGKFVSESPLNTDSSSVQPDTTGNILSDQEITWAPDSIKSESFETDSAISCSFITGDMIMVRGTFVVINDFDNQVLGGISIAPDEDKNIPELLSAIPETEETHTLKIDNETSKKKEKKDTDTNSEKLAVLPKENEEEDSSEKP